MIKGARQVMRVKIIAAIIDAIVQMIRRLNSFYTNLELNVARLMQG